MKNLNEKKKWTESTIIIKLEINRNITKTNKNDKTTWQYYNSRVFKANNTKITLLLFKDVNVQNDWQF